MTGSAIIAVRTLGTDLLQDLRKSLLDLPDFWARDKSFHIVEVFDRQLGSARYAILSQCTIPFACERFFGRIPALPT